jgi:integrase
VYTSEKEVEDFLTEYGRSKIIIESTARAILNRAIEFEYKFNKPFHLFTAEEVLAMYESAHAVSVVSLQNTNLLLKNASRWLRHKNGGAIDSAYEHITKDMLETVIDIEKQKSMVLSRDDVEEMMDQLLNWTDKCILFLLFNGVGGYKLDELTFLKWEQVSRADLKVYFKNGKTIDITPGEYEMLKKGFEEDELVSFGSTTRVSKVRSLGLYKARFNSLSDNDNADDPGDIERRYRWCQRRLIMIGRDLGMTVTSGALQNSGLLWHLQQKVKEMGVGFREFTKGEEALNIARRYGIFSIFYSQMLWEKFSTYFEED